MGTEGVKDKKQPYRVEQETLLLKLKRRFKAKVLLSTTAFLLVLTGFFTILFLFSKPIGKELVDYLHNTISNTFPDFFLKQSSLFLTLFIGVSINIVLFLLCFFFASIISYFVAKNVTPRGEFSNYGKLCIKLSRQTVSSGIIHIISGVVIICGGIFLLFHYFGVNLAYYQFHLLIELGLAVFIMGIAILIPLPILLSEPREFSKPPVQPVEDRSPARANGRQLLEILRKSPVFRRQIICDREIKQFPFVADSEDLLSRLRTKYPMIKGILAHTNIRCFTAAQARALADILNNIESGRSNADYSFIGWPGSGRTTLANLLCLCAVLHRRGSIYFSTPESAHQSLDSAGKYNVTARHPATQMKTWLSAAGLTDSIRIQEAYMNNKDQMELHLENKPDIIFSDVNILSRDLLSKVQNGAKNFVSRLEFVIIDHPERLSRENLIRLRISMARLRMTAELTGANITFLVLLPRLNNFAEVSKFILNNTNVVFHEFSTWPGNFFLAGWLPPLELLDRHAERPTLIRSEFTEEVVALLTELGYQSNKLSRPLRIAIIDSIPLLGPEARSYIRERIRIQLGIELRDQQSITIMSNWKYFSTMEISIDSSHEFDVIVCLGIGCHPEHLVSCLRKALAQEGLMILIAESSQSDIESIRNISRPEWDPIQEAIVGIKYPTLLLPKHSDAIVAHELAGLFEAFYQIPIPLQRLIEILPGDYTHELLRELEALEYIEKIMAFETIQESMRPKQKPYIHCVDSKLKAADFMIPWGCCSRRVYRIYDVTAYRDVSPIAHQLQYIDEDRLFIDYHPKAVLRHPPNSVKIIGLKTAQPLETERHRQFRRFLETGQINISAMPYDAGVGLDKRLARFDTNLISERWHVLPDKLFEIEETGEPTQRGIFNALKAADGPDYLKNLPGWTPAKSKTIYRDLIIQNIERPVIGTANVKPALTIAGGMWIGLIQESIRDVVKTDRRLVEEPLAVQGTSLSKSEKLERTFECQMLSLFIEKFYTSEEQEGSKKEDEQQIDEAVLSGLAGHHALARCIRFYLNRKYLDFDKNFRIALISNPESETLSEYRILIYYLRREELEPGNHNLKEMVLEPHNLREIMKWTHRRLQSCDCDDGCTKCCGGLGAIPENMLPFAGFTEKDVISRKKAYLLACAILGYKPDWNLFYAGSISTKGERRLIDSMDELQRLVTEVIGSPDDYKDGIWYRLFGGWMPVWEEILADVRWMTEDEQKNSKAAGLYKSGSNEICVRPGQDADTIRKVLVHEFAHNWQYKAEKFDLEEHQNTPEAKKYFNGNLVIEGHATWSDQQFILEKGIGPHYTRNDGRPWNEYKVGYLLMEGIEKAVGERGFYAWIKEGADSGEPDIRSRNPRLAWPFNIKDALEAMNLSDEARSGSFTDFDVFEEPDIS